MNDDYRPEPLPVRTPGQTRAAEEAAGAMWRAALRFSAARGVARVGTAADRGEVAHRRTASGFGRSAATKTVLRMSGDGGRSPRPNSASAIFDAFKPARPVGEPAGTVGGDEELLIQIPVRAKDVDHAVLLAGSLARCAPPLSEYGIGQTKVVRAVVGVQGSGTRVVAAVFCNSILGEGRHCGKAYKHQGDCAPM
jgi:hypothetical protein